MMRYHDLHYPLTLLRWASKGHVHLPLSREQSSLLFLLIKTDISALTVEAWNRLVCSRCRCRTFDEHRWDAQFGVLIAEIFSWNWSSMTNEFSSCSFLDHGHETWQRHVFGGQLNSHLCLFFFFLVAFSLAIHPPSRKAWERKFACSTWMS